MAGLYTPELADEILRRLETQPLQQICRDEGMPAASTVRLWVNENRGGDFAERYARARTMLLENMAEEILTISDESVNDYMQIEDEKGRTRTVVDQENVQRSKLRVDARKWLLSKLRPEVYGDRQQLEHSGPGGGKLEVVVRSVLDAPPKSE